MALSAGLPRSFRFGPRGELSGLTCFPFRGAAPVCRLAVRTVMRAGRIAGVNRPEGELTVRGVLRGGENVIPKNRRLRGARTAAGSRQGRPFVPLSAVSSRLGINTRTGNRLWQARRHVPDKSTIWWMRGSTQRRTHGGAQGEKRAVRRAQEAARTASEFVMSLRLTSYRICRDSKRRNVCERAAEWRLGMTGKMRELPSKSLYTGKLMEKRGEKGGATPAPPSPL